MLKRANSSDAKFGAVVGIVLGGAIGWALGDIVGIIIGVLIGAVAGAVMGHSPTSSGTVPSTRRPPWRLSGSSDFSRTRNMRPSLLAS